LDIEQNPLKIEPNHWIREKYLKKQGEITQNHNGLKASLIPMICDFPIMWENPTQESQIQTKNVEYKHRLIFID